MKITLVAVLVMFAQVSLASDFCDGFKEGYRLIKGNNFTVPVCPVEPARVTNATMRQQGMKAGMRAAKRYKLSLCPFTTRQLYFVE